MSVDVIVRKIDNSKITDSELSQAVDKLKNVAPEFKIDINDSSVSFNNTLMATISFGSYTEKTGETSHWLILESNYSVYQYALFIAKFLSENISGTIIEDPQEGDTISPGDFRLKGITIEELRKSFKGSV